MQLCESPSHLTGGLRAQAEGNAKPRPRGPHKAPSDTATPGHESALPSVVRTLRKLLGGPGDPCSPCVGEHAAPTMVLLPPLAQGGASGLSPALSGHETQREDSPCRPAAVRGVFQWCICTFRLISENGCGLLNIFPLPAGTKALLLEGLGRKSSPSCAQLAGPCSPSFSSTTLL